MGSSLQSEIDDLIRKLYQVSDHSKQESKKVFSLAAKPIIQEIKNRAPKSSAPHSRNDEHGVDVTYYPGNLRRSIKKLVFKRSAAVFVGPKVSKEGGIDEFKGARTDGYYGHWVEFGTVNMPPRAFVRPAVQAVGGTALRIASKGLKEEIDKYARQLRTKKG